MATELSYILKQDVLTYLDSNTLEEMTGGRKAIGDNPPVLGNDSIWLSLEKNAIEDVKGYSRHWYDMATEMRPYFDHNVSDLFVIGQRVAGAPVDGVRPLYVCIQDAPPGTSLTNTSFFTEVDDRNSKILEITCVLLIYKLFRRKNPNQIPDQRNIDLDFANSQLKDIQKGVLTFDIKEREDVPADDSGQEIAYGDFEDVTQDIY